MKEINRQKRHEEIVDLRNKSIEVYSNKMDALLEILKK